jgi:hypothetical protein
MLLTAATAASTARVATKTVTIHLAGSGVGNWSVDSPSDLGKSALSYSWRGVLKFKIPTAALKKPATRKFRVPSSTTLVASWDGVLEGQKLTGFAQGPYRCEYHGKGVKAAVTALLTNGVKRGTLDLFLHPRAQEQFFAPTGEGATVNCTTNYGAEGPPHFGPNWLFRDTTSVRNGNRYWMTSNTAIITVPTKLLPRGSAKLVFPREVGGRDSPFIGKLNWKNLGKLVVRAT